MAKLVSWDYLIEKAKAAGNVSSANALSKAKSDAVGVQNSKANSTVNNVIPVSSAITASQNAENEKNGWTKYSYDVSQWYMDLMRDYLRDAKSAQRDADMFNAEQAQIQRDWSEAMSGSAHQREVNDLRAAGLNPVISAYGSGASVGSGAAASSSNQLVGALGGIAASMAGSISSLANALETNASSVLNTSLSNLANYSAQATQRSMNEMQVELGRYQSNLNAEVQMYAAKLSSNTNLSMNAATNQMNKYIAEINNMNQQEIAAIAAQANVTSADIHAAASRYSAEIAYNAAIQTNRESTSASFEGFATSILKRAGNAIANLLANPQKAY